MGTSTSTSTSTSTRTRTGAGADVEALYERHWGPMVRMALLLVDDVAAAEDVVQDAFVALHRRAHRLREPAAALGYLRTSVVNGARSQLRRRGVARRHLGAVVTPHAEPADRPVIVAAEGRDRRGPRGLEGHREVERQPRPGRAAVDVGRAAMSTSHEQEPVAADPIEQRLERALASTATATLPDDTTRPDFATVVARADEPRRRAARVSAPLLAAAAVLVVALAIALIATGGRGRTPPGAGPTTGPRRSDAPVVGPNTRFDPPGVGFCDNFSTACAELNFEPLYPFHSYVQARRWYVAHRSDTSAGPFDPERTADRYLHGVLGLTGLETRGGDVSGGSYDVIDLAVGYRSDGSFHDVGAIELVRYSIDHRGPWEVVGSPRSRGFAITGPRGGARVTYGGYPVDGRDAPAGSRVRVRVLGGTTVGSARVGASGRWSAQVTPTASHVTVLIATSGGRARRPEHLYVLGVHR